MATQDESLFAHGSGRGADDPVECLGLTFASDHDRRAHFIELLREELKQPDFRSIEGFPIAEDEDILALSDPPYYTACPNPWLADFVAQCGKPYEADSDDYEREPFAADVSEGKNDPIYNAHTYHTKVPHKAIMRYILHYTEPGDVVLDGFCGTGMTGVAAQLCGDRRTVESLGFTVEVDGTIRDERGAPFSKLGSRRAVLNDLSPAATFIAYNYNAPADWTAFEVEAERLLDEVERRCGWMWMTHDPETGRECRVRYTVWSDVFSCPACSAENVFFSAVTTGRGDGTARVIVCDQCGSEYSRRKAARRTESVFDPFLGTTVVTPKRIPVLIAYDGARRVQTKEPDEHDLSTLERVRNDVHMASVPILPLMLKEGKWGDLQRGYHEGITHLHHFFFPRVLSVLDAMFEEIQSRGAADEPRRLLTLLFTSQLVNLSLMNRYRPTVSFPYNPMSGTLYVGSQVSEANPFVAYRNKVKRLVAAKQALSGTKGVVCTSTQSTAGIGAPLLDYVFVDPPFGDNLPYSELSFIWEGWLRVITNQQPEAIVSTCQSKSVADYQALMQRCLEPLYACLKPGRWMTVEFHNSKNGIWQALQEAMSRAGFVVADVRVLDKQGQTKKQATGRNAVNKDLVISAYRPRQDVEQVFAIQAGSTDAAWIFVRGHLAQLPVVVQRDRDLEALAERQAYLLYDRMVAFHVQRGVRVPLSSPEFYAGLEQRFPCRDSMYFLQDQVAEYDKKRLSAAEVRQLELFVTDEASAIQWLRQTLAEKPLSFQDLNPVFMREIAGWEKHEKALELGDLLRENFLCYSGTGEVPGPIHAYLSSNFRYLRGLEKNVPALCAKAKDRWYVPDPRKAGDLEQLRERTLLKEFDDYAAGKGKLKLFRLEAVRAGFKRAWQERDYQTIISVAERVPADVLQEDAKLLMWYDQALTRAGE